MTSEKYIILTLALLLALAIFQAVRLYLECREEKTQALYYYSVLKMATCCEFHRKLYIKLRGSGRPIREIYSELLAERQTVARGETALRTFMQLARKLTQESK